MKVSVIVPNHGRDITLLVRSIHNSTYKDVELIEINVGKERSVQRNLGIEQATGDAYLILDSDQSISKYLIEECVDLCQHGFSAVFVPEVIRTKGFFGSVRAFERIFFTGTAVDVPRFVIRKACPRFNETITGPEDAEWGRRIKGYKIVSQNPLFHHDNISLWDYMKKKAYYSKSMKKYILLCPDDPCVNLWYRCVTVYTEHGKWKALVRHPILTLGIVFMLLIRGIIYATAKS